MNTKTYKEKMDELKVRIVTREYIFQLTQLMQLHNKMEMLQVEVSGCSQQYMEIVMMGEALPHDVREEALADVRQRRNSKEAQMEDLDKDIARNSSDFLKAAQDYEQIGGKPNPKWVNKASK